MCDVYIYIMCILYISIPMWPLNPICTCACAKEEKSSGKAESGA